MAQRGAPWQMSVLHGICCVTGCLHWNIRAQCPSSDDQLVIAESARAVFELSFLSSCLHSASLPSFVFSPARRCPLLSPTTKISQHAKIKTQAHERIHRCQSWRCVTGSLTEESQLGVTDSAFCPLLSLSCFVRTKWNDVNRGGVMSSLLKTKTEHKQNCSSPSFPRCLYIYKHALTFKLKKKKLQIWILLGTFYMCNYNVIFVVVFILFTLRNLGAHTGGCTCSDQLYEKLVQVQAVRVSDCENIFQSWADNVQKKKTTKTWADVCSSSASFLPSVCHSFCFLVMHTSRFIVIIISLSFIFYGVFLWKYFFEKWSSIFLN